MRCSSERARPGAERRERAKRSSRRPQPARRRSARAGEPGPEPWPEEHGGGEQQQRRRPTGPEERLGAQRPRTETPHAHAHRERELGPLRHEGLRAEAGLDRTGGGVGRPLRADRRTDRCGAAAVGRRDDLDEEVAGGRRPHRRSRLDPDDAGLARTASCRRFGRPRRRPRRAGARRRPGPLRPGRPRRRPRRRRANRRSSAAAGSPARRRPQVRASLPARRARA